MSEYIPTEVLDEIQELTESWQYEKAVDMVNDILVRDPKNEQALLMITDILYRQWDMEWAEKQYMTWLLLHPYSKEREM